jgi:hypothetical protein
MGQRSRQVSIFGLVLISILISSELALAQFTQQGPHLFGTGAVPGANGGAEQGYSVALAADGNTAIVGGPVDNSFVGAAWVWTRSGGTWTQQGSKLVGTGAVDIPYGAPQGVSVALSADGNTAIVGGYHDNSTAGAAWIFTRAKGAWAQQGTKLVGTGAVGNAQQGTSVALSADGNTAIVGGPYDNTKAGAAWVYTRTNGIWSQQGSRLLANGAVADMPGRITGENAYQGNSVALSADGNTAIVGGPYDNGQTGAAWVYTRNKGVWTQQGSKLVGTGAVAATDGIGAEQGWSVALSGDGNTAILGGIYDDAGNGAAWVFTRAKGVWTQQGKKLVGTGAVGPAAYQGWSVALSADGNTAIVGGPYDSPDVGAAWVYTCSGGVWTQLGN